MFNKKDYPNGLNLYAFPASFFCEIHELIIGCSKFIFYRLIQDVKTDKQYLIQRNWKRLHKEKL